MKKHTKLFFILLIAATLFYSENLTELFHDEFSNKKHISGAYEALNFLGARQRYPYKTIPRNAHTQPGKNGIMNQVVISVKLLHPGKHWDPITGEAEPWPLP